MNAKEKPFGLLLRETRVAKGYSLRKFATMIDVSPTYLSQVEQGKVERPPTAERVRVMAQLLGQNPEHWIVLAGRMPDQLVDIIQKQPEAVPDLLRAISHMDAAQLRRLTEQAKRNKDKGSQ